MRPLLHPMFITGLGVIAAMMLGVYVSEDAALNSVAVCIVALLLNEFSALPRYVRRAFWPPVRFMLFFIQSLTILIGGSNAIEHVAAHAPRAFSIVAVATLVGALGAHVILFIWKYCQYQ
jgi:hypothetical protein